MDQMKQAFGRASGTVTPAPITPPDRIHQTVEGIRVNTHYKVLIVGQRGDNFPQEYRRHPQIELWDSDGKIVAENIPMAVRLVLMTKFNSHPTLNSVRRVCEQRGVLCPVKVYGTGEIKVLLAPLMQRALPQAEPVERQQETVVTPSARRFVKGELSAFIRQYGDVNKRPVAAEAKRLHKLAEAAGWSTTEGSIVQAMYLIRTGDATPPAPTAAPPQPVVAAPTPVAKPESGLSQDEHVILGMLDGAQQQLASITHQPSEVTAALALMRQDVMQRSEKRGKIRAALAALSAIKDEDL